MLTVQTATYLNDAAAYLNKHLFNSQLPNVLITISRKKGALGYFFPGAFAEGSENIDEIALTPSSLCRPTIETLGTLLHEQCHLWQQHFGKPSANAYHNKQWAKKMIEVGLEPFCITNPNKTTGFKCSHNINPNGAFLPIATKFIELRGEIPVQTSGYVRTKLVKVNHRPKLVCPSCKKSFTIPAAVNVKIVCQDCDEEMEQK